ncbi:hypothetical protein [Rhodococcoides fascians]
MSPHHRRGDDRQTVVDEHDRRTIETKGLRQSGGQPEVFVVFTGQQLVE